jgi:hypothetical protein
MSHSFRSRRAWGLLAASLVGLSLVASPAAAGAGNGVGDPDAECASFGFTSGGAKYDAQPPIGGSVSFTEDGQSFTIQAGDSKGVVSGWTSTTPLAGVIVKGGNGAIAYPVTGTSQTGVAYVTPTNESGGPADISHVTLCYAGPLTPTEDPAPPAPLALSLDASGAYTKTFLWSIDKSVDRPWIARAGDAAPLHYDVPTVNTGYDLSAIVVGGTVTVTNPNAVVRPLTALAVTPDLGSCAVTAPAEVAPGDSEVPFTCTVSTNVEADLAALDVTASSPSATTPASAAVAWDLTAVNEQVSVSDAFDGGTAEVLATTSYDRSAPTPATVGCRTVTNTATIVETGQSDTVQSTVCRQYVTAGGFTIGFWGNKNGEKVVVANAARICSSLAAYANVLTLPAPCNATTLVPWVKATLGAATSKDTGVAMFRAQFLATALNVTTDTVNHLGETDVVVSSALLGTTCASVSQLLAAGNALLPSSSTNKVWVTGVKDAYDAINNNRQAVCSS